MYLMLASGLPAWGQYAPWGLGQSRAWDLTIKLVTIDPGDDLTMWWGHTAVVVEDTNLNISLFYNYGLFSFEQEDFISNFMMGRLIFWVGAWNTSSALEYYQGLNRSIRIQTLNLSPRKKLEMAQFLAKNVLPENKNYLYDHYYDNCSTRVRDLINRIVNAKFEQDTKRPAPLTLRQHTRRHTYHNFIMDWILMFLMNDSIDKPIQRWDEMFLPTEMERYITELRYIDEDGSEKAMVQDTVTFYKAKGARSIPQQAPAHWPFSLVLGISVSIIIIFLAYKTKTGNSSARILMAVHHIFVGILFGIPGTILLLMAAFTDHIVTYHNENLLLANPFTLFALPIGISLILKRDFGLKWADKLSYLLAALGILLLLLKILPSFDQDNRLAISLILPILITGAVSWYIIKKK
jgi:hypothetical protein